MKTKGQLSKASDDYNDFCIIIFQECINGKKTGTPSPGWKFSMQGIGALTCRWLIKNYNRWISNHCNCNRQFAFVSPTKSERWFVGMLQQVKLQQLFHYNLPTGLNELQCQLVRFFSCNFFVCTDFCFIQ